jgi:hypothetical protein
LNYKDLLAKIMEINRAHIIEIEVPSLIYTENVCYTMVKKEKYRYGVNETKAEILNYILKNDVSLSEVAIWKHLSETFGKIDRSIVNRHLHDLMGLTCVMLIPPEKKGLGNHWSIPILKNLNSILREFPDLVETLQNSEIALKIVLDALEYALTASTNLSKTKEYKKKHGVIKTHLLTIRKDLTTKLKMSSAFFKLCVQDEYSLYRNLRALLEISDDNEAKTFIGDDFTLFINSPSCVDLVFKSCVVLEIMERKEDSRKYMKEEMDYITEMNNFVSKDKLDPLKKYYEKLKNEADILNQIEKIDPDKQLEFLKQHYKKLLKAPSFLQGKKFIKVTNSELCRLENDFQNHGDNDDVWDYLEDEELEDPA